MMITSTKLANFKIEQLETLVAQQAAVIEQMRDKFISIQEYWNRAHTQEAAVDACYHAINMAEEALTLQPCPEVLNKVRAVGFDRNVMCEEETMTENNAVLIAAPKLAELKSRPCTLEELQAALVNLIELYNKQGEAMNAAINRKQDREWRATI